MVSVTIAGYSMPDSASSASFEVRWSVPWSTSDWWNHRLNWSRVMLSVAATAIRVIPSRRAFFKISRTLENTSGD